MTRHGGARPWAASAGLLLALLLPACGLQEAPGRQGQGADAAPPAAAPATGGPATTLAAPTPTPVAPGTSATQPPRAASDAAAAVQAPARTTPGASPTSRRTTGDRTGVDDKARVVRIAVHGVPLGGDGSTVRAAAERYWREGPGGRPRTLANGYAVEPVYFDDRGSAAAARRACSTQAGSAFLLYAVGGPEQVQACATSEVLRRNGVPYLSTGVGESGLGALRHYVATSPTYEQQAPLLVRAARDGGFFAGRWAVVSADGAYTGARDAMASALTRSGARFDPQADVFTVPDAPRDCSALGTTLRERRYGAIWFLAPQPAFFAQCVGVVGDGPTWTGPGAGLAYEVVADLACGASPRFTAVHLHPVTGLDEAAERAGRSFDDDVEYQVHAAMQTVEAALNRVQGPLTREALLEALRRRGLPDGIAPGTHGGGPFGGKAVHALRARCGGSPGRNGWTTLGRYDRQP